MRAARSTDPRPEPLLPFTFRGDLLMWTEDDRLMRWNHAANDWLEAPVGLRAAIRSASDGGRTRMEGLLRDSIVFALLLFPLASLVAIAPRLFASESLSRIWFWAALTLFAVLGYWVMRSRS